MRTGRTPRTVTADRGYGEAKVDQQLNDLGVSTRDKNWMAVS